jgi:membrane-bound lytic murein transglycosylase D
MAFFKSVPKRAVEGAVIGFLLICWPFFYAGATLNQPEVRSDRDTDFPMPACLKPAVDFWSNAFSAWPMNQVALHDDEYLGVVYRLLDIPGEAGEGLTSGQRQWIRSQEVILAQNLEEIASDLSAGRALSSEQRHLLNSIEQGNGKIDGAAERVRSQRGVRERFLRGLEASGAYLDLFRQAFRAQGLPEDLAFLPHVESSFCNGARSSVGAAGMWQFMPSTGRLFMTINASVDERLNPATAARSAARYFGDIYRKLESWPLVITSYNHGVGGMCRAQDQFGNDFGRIVQQYDSPSFGFASRNFYAEFLAARRIAKSPEKFFPEGVHFHTSLSIKPWTLNRSMYSRDISRHLGVATSTLAGLNPGWTNIALMSKKPLPAGVTVWVPAGRSIEDLPEPPETVLAEARPASPQRKHRIAKGETLWSISRRYGVSLDALKKENGITARTRIVPGDELSLPDGSRKSDARIVLAQKSGSTSSAKARAKSSIKTHRVRSGETPVGIASIYRVPLRALLAVNKMRTTSLIKPGQTLFIPIQQ